MQKLSTRSDINRIRVAYPCSVGWESMTGDERVRTCHSCKLNVYNTAEMTEQEVQNMIDRREGRLCIRIHRRADGTVITKNCPVGLREYRKRVVRSIGATLSLIMSLLTSGFSQKDKSLEPPPSTPLAISVDNQDKKTEIVGRVTDPNGAVVPGAKLLLYKDKDKKKYALTSHSDADGNYTFSSVSPGTYILEVKASGFKRAITQNIKVINGYISEVNVDLEVAGGSICVGIVAEEPLTLIETTPSSVTTVITLRKVPTIPHK